MKLFNRSKLSGPDDPALDGWYHTIDFGEGIVSKGVFDHRSVVEKYGLPPSLKGKTALDVGTGDGFFAFELERRGADVVTAIDVDTIGECDWAARMRPRVSEEIMTSGNWKKHFEMAHRLLKSRVRRVPCDVYELSPERVGTFDVVFCGDLLLHLQNPLKALERIRSVTRRAAVIETTIDEKLEEHAQDQPYMRFGAREAETEPGELNTFWRFTTRALEDMLIYADFGATYPQGVFHLPPQGIAATAVVATVAPGPGSPW